MRAQADRDGAESCRGRREAARLAGGGKSCMRVSAVVWASGREGGGEGAGEGAKEGAKA